tara:strand:- start:548 stop:700 length:153 start_codon:yes stop_codon:yes gene_type:complete
MDKHEYEIVVYEYGVKRHYRAKDKKEALKLYVKYSEEYSPENVKIFKIKK